MTDLPAVVRAKALDVGADRWLTELPTLVEEIADRWGLTLGRVFGDATEAYVREAECEDGTPAVLKLLVPRRSAAAANEITVLRLAAGEGCAALFQYDVDRGAMLLERLGPAMVDQNIPQTERLSILSDLARAIWRPRGAAGDAPQLAAEKGGPRKAGPGGVRGVGPAGVRGMGPAGVRGVGSAGVRGVGPGGVRGVGSAGVRGVGPGGVRGVRPAGVRGVEPGGVRGVGSAGVPDVKPGGWRGSPRGDELPSGAEKAAWLAREIRRRWDELGEPCSRRAMEHAVAAAERRRRGHDPERAVLVHGDVHQWNALVAGEGYKLVDPDGLWAEPECDLGVLMREDPVELMAGDPWDRARLLAERTGTDAQAIWEWGVAERVSTGLLAVAIGLQPVGAEMLAAADAIAAA